MQILNIKVKLYKSRRVIENQLQIFTPGNSCKIWGFFGSLQIRWFYSKYSICAFDQIHKSERRFQKVIENVTKKCQNATLDFPLILFSPLDGFMECWVFSKHSNCHGLSSNYIVNMASHKNWNPTVLNLCSDSPSSFIIQSFEMQKNRFSHVYLLSSFIVDPKQVMVFINNTAMHFFMKQTLGCTTLELLFLRSLCFLGHYTFLSLKEIKKAFSSRSEKYSNIYLQIPKCTPKSAQKRCLKNYEGVLEVKKW